MNNSSMRAILSAPDNTPTPPITSSDVELALLALHHYPVKTASDALLVMCAANLLNAAVKQKGLAVFGGYGFKGRVSELVETWCAHPIEGIAIQAYKDVCYVEIDTIQFSFHHLAAQEKITCIAQKEPWRGIRLQPLAKRLWDEAFSRVSITDLKAQQCFEVLSQAWPFAVLKALDFPLSIDQLASRFPDETENLILAIALLEKHELLIKRPFDEKIRINRWTMTLLQYHLAAFGARKADHETAH